MSKTYLAPFALLVVLGAPLLGCSTIERSPPVVPVAMESETGAPRWVVGDTWYFKITTSRGPFIHKARVDAITEHGGKPAYKVDLQRFGWWGGTYGDPQRTLILGGDDLGMVAEKIQGQTVRWIDGSNGLLFPLATGNTWERRGVLHVRAFSGGFLDRYRVEGQERVTVSAGTFDAFRVAREDEFGNWDENWFAPSVGQFVKRRGYAYGFTYEEELSDFFPGDRSVVTARRDPG